VTGPRLGLRSWYQLREVAQKQIWSIVSAPVMIVDT
jgi:hypothetical protein